MKPDWGNISTLRWRELLCRNISLHKDDAKQDGRTFQYLVDETQGGIIFLNQGDLGHDIEAIFYIKMIGTKIEDRFYIKIMGTRIEEHVLDNNVREYRWGNQ